MHKSCQQDLITQEIFRKIWKQSYDEKLQNITGLMIWQKNQICFVHIEKEAKWKPQETFIGTFSWKQTIGIFFTSESTLHVSQVYSIRRFRMDCKEHNRENALMKVIKCNEDNTVLLCKVKWSRPGDVGWNDVGGVTHFEILVLMGRRLKWASKLVSWY